MIFESPYFLIFLILIPIIIYLKLRTNFFSQNKFKISTLSYLKKSHNKAKNTWLNLPFALTIIAFSLLTLTLARPQMQYKLINHHLEGIEIMLVMDTSISMWFVDDEMRAMKRVGFDPFNKLTIYENPNDKLKNRINIAKKVIEEFVNKKYTDKIGLVAFKAQAFTLTPPTIKLSYLKHLIRNLNLSMIKKDGTAIGDAIGTSINALKYSQSKNKIIILITDGNDNQETLSTSVLSQKKAAEIAAEKKIKIYTIGMGGMGRVFAPYIRRKPIRSIEESYEDYEKPDLFYEFGSEQMNEYPLREISRITGGKFYRANNETELTTIYDDIDKLEKSKFKDDERFSFEKEEIFYYFLYPALAILIIAFSLKYTILRVIP
ncbi:MAG: VWA domain-containing protein [Spirochaetota bacterium]|nr:VWA domain-containing protein [Spirochaetota bacterium]